MWFQFPIKCRREIGSLMASKSRGLCALIVCSTARSEVERIALSRCNGFILREPPRRQKHLEGIVASRLPTPAPCPWQERLSRQPANGGTCVCRSAGLEPALRGKGAMTKPTVRPKPAASRRSGSGVRQRATTPECTAYQPTDTGGDSHSQQADVSWVEVQNWLGIPAEHFASFCFKAVPWLLGSVCMNNDGPSKMLISKLLSLASVQLKLSGQQRDEVLGELVQHIPEIADQPEAQQRLLRALQEREQLHTTAIGDGIALPHARNALVGLVEQPVIVFGRHDQGLQYGAVDGQPAKLFFLLVAPNVTQHLQILARISRLLRDPRLRQSLLVAERPDKVIALIREAETHM